MWRGESGVSAGGEPLRGRSDRVERWCDAVAAEIAAPVADLRSQFDASTGLAEEPECLADRYRCSTLVVLIRLRDTGLVRREGFQNIYDVEVDRLRKAAEGNPRGGAATSTTISHSGWGERSVAQLFAIRCAAPRP